MLGGSFCWSPIRCIKPGSDSAHHTSLKSSFWLDWSVKFIKTHNLFLEVANTTACDFYLLGSQPLCGCQNLCG
ncbi:hypothetical protein AB205_0082230 [Aquarana catesbeiana]|uniref:Uncharacterized protein n=1 Tax=Aquarana catesbeiana TaxID=8400 RepID=A0A2G9S517_AQUCT|nr:hypothetical protein AB205_0082230 [Aquarana catesbeiana]PIO35269.1 hypothetical protein AB205_0082230 [Aquarana catesbeiana]